MFPETEGVRLGTVRAILAIAAIAYASCTPAGAFAAGMESEEKVLFNIPQQRTDQALIQFAQQADVTFIFSFDEAQTITVNPLVGWYTREEAIAKLLENTGLQSELRADGVLEIGSDVQVLEEDDTVTEARKGVLAAILGMFTVAGGAANAQDQEGAVVRLEEVIVTAERREANVQDVPIPVTAFSSQDLVDASFHDLYDLNNLVPGLSIGGSGALESQVALRGLAPPNAGIGQDEPVALYVDGVYQGHSPDNFRQAMLGVERIEVLRGPQGTLYGRNAVGGAIVVTTRKPTEEPEAEIKVGAGNYETGELATLVSGPLGDRVFGMLTARVFDRAEGFKYNLASTRPSDGNSEKSFRGVLRFVPTDDLEINLIADRSRYKGAGNGPMRNILDHDVHPGCTTCDRDPNDRDWEHYYGWPNGDEQQNDLDSPLVMEVNDWLESNGHARQLMFTDEGAEIDRGGFAVSVDYDVSGMLFRSVTSYRYNDFESTIDTYSRPHPTVTNMTYSLQDQFAQELTLQTTDEGRWQWLAGLAYFEENIELVNIFRRVHCRDSDYNFSGLYLGQPGCVVDNHSEEILKYNAARLRLPTIDTQSLALFGQATYQISDRLSGTIGVRWSDEEKEWTHGFKEFTRPIALMTQSRASESWDAVSPKIGLTYDVNDDAILYATMAQGFKAGGFNARSAAPEGESVEPESSVQYEVGVKSQLADNRVRVNAAAFFNDYTDLQLRVFCPPTDPVCGGSTALTNAAGAEIKGAEIEFSAAATDRLTVSGFVSFLDAAFTDYKPNENDDFTGNGLPRAPELQYAVSGNYLTTLANGGELTLNGSYRWSDWEWFRADNAPLDRNRSNQNLNARLSYREPNGRWEVALWGNNLTDENYRNNAFAIGPLTVAVFYNEPRLIGLEFLRRMTD